MAAVRYKVPIDAYPRFRYFQKRLASIIPRWHKLVATGKFEQCISQGDKTFRIIMAAAKSMQGDVSVTVVVGDVMIPASFTSELLVGVGKDLEGEITHESVDKKRVADDILICLMTSVSSPLTVRKLLDQFSSLKNEQQENVIVYDVDSRKNYSFSELKEVKYDRREVRLGPVNEALGLQIQHLLEDRAVMILETIVDFNNNFVPAEGEYCGMPIDLECSDQIFRSLKDPHIVDDLDPEKTCMPNPTAMDTGDEPRKLSEEEKNSMFFENLMEFISKKTKNIFCNNLAKKYGIKPSLVNEFLNKGYHDYERKYRAGANGVMKPRWAKAKTCSEASTIAYNYVTRQVKTLNAVEHYLKRVLKVLVEFEKLNFEVFGLLRKAKVQVEVKIPVYPEMPAKMTDELLSLPEVVGCGTIYGKLTIHVRPDLKREEEEKIKVILTEHRYQHSFKLLTCKGRCPQAQQFVKSGDQLKAELTPETYERLKEENKKLKKENKDAYNEIGKEKLGTLGCFIGLRKNPANSGHEKLASSDQEKAASSDQEKASKSGQEAMECEGATSAGNVARLYGITCAHCVTDCLPGVKVEQDLGYTEFGQTEHVLDEQEKIDIAAIHVTMDKQKCNPDIMINSPGWEFYTGSAGDASLVAKAVYKHGATSGYTKGIIISNDYKPELRQNYRDSLMNQANKEKKCNFQDNFNILVDIFPASRSQRPLDSPETDELQPQDSGGPGLGSMPGGDSGSRSAPVFTSPLTQSTKVKARETVTLECVIGGQPKPQVSWFHGDTPLTHTGDILLQTQGNTHRLVIKKAFSQDAGFYRVEASNTSGREESRCTLEVEKEVFSEEGDSGAVIYFEDDTSESVVLLSLLGGNLQYEEGGATQSVTYSSHLKKSLDALCEKCNCEIVMPWDI